MKHLAILVVLASIGSSAFSQTVPLAASSPKVSVISKGHDVRDILSSIFLQAKQPYVLQPNLHFSLFLSLTDLEFEKALKIVCKQAGLEYQVSEEGIYYVRTAQAKPKAPEHKTVIATVEKPKKADEIAVPADVMKAHLTTHLHKVSVRYVFAEFARQTGAEIEVAPEVPNFRMDATMIKTSLRYAMDKVCKASGLNYGRVGDKIEVTLLPDKG